MRLLKTMVAMLLFFFIAAQINIVESGVWTDIKKSSKKVWKEVKKDSKEVGKDIKDTTYTAEINHITYAEINQAIHSQQSV